VVALGLTHDSKKDYAFFRTAAEKVLWPHIEAQYREELKGIAEGLKAKNVPLDLWDVVVLNAWLELTPYYTGWYDQDHNSPRLGARYPNTAARSSRPAVIPKTARSSSRTTTGLNTRKPPAGISSSTLHPRKATA